MSAIGPLLLHFHVTEHDELTGRDVDEMRLDTTIT
jgi:hypothetical protein